MRVGKRRAQLGKCLSDPKIGTPSAAISLNDAEVRFPSLTSPIVASVCANSAAASRSSSSCR